MNDCENVVKSISNIVKIVGIVHEVYKMSKQLYLDKPKPQLSKIRKKRRKHAGIKRRSVYITDKEKESCEEYIKQFEEKDEKEFFKVTRMSIASFNLLLSVLKKKLTRLPSKKSVDPETRLAITLIYLAQGCSIKALTWGFNLGQSTVQKFVYETCEAIWDELNQAYISSSKCDERQMIADEFYAKTAMPNCIGAIAAKHIHVNGSRRGEILNFRSKLNSIAVLAACDTNYIFKYVEIVDFTSENDDDPLELSAQLSAFSETLSDADSPSHSTTFPYYYVGKHSYPIKSSLLVPYSEESLTPKKKKFNSAILKAWLYIENTFGVFAFRWQIFKTKIQCSRKNAEKITRAAILLHNFLILERDEKYFTLDIVDSTKNGKYILGQWRKHIQPLESFKPKSTNRLSACESREKVREFLEKIGD